jgi:7-carboxy-7-deazaguanine synthase
MEIEQIIDKIDLLGGELVEITGGEPLLQRESVPLCQRLIERGKTVLIETNGSLDIGRIPPLAVVIMDIKTPGSLMSERMNWNNIDRLRKTDEVKFVICSRKDFDWAWQKVKAFGLDKKARLSMSPAYGLLAPEMLARWILEDNLPVRLQLQLHKIIWGADAKGV